MRGAQCLRFSLSSAKYSPAPAHRDPFYDLVPSRLSASQSFIKGSGRYACRRGGTFAPPKVPKSGLGQAPRPHAPERPLGKPKGGFPKRGLNGAYKGLWAHLPPSPPLPRSGGGGSCPTSCLSQFSAWQVPSAMPFPRQISFPHPLTATR